MCLAYTQPRLHPSSSLLHPLLYISAPYHGCLQADILAAMAKGGMEPLLDLGLPPEQAQLLAAVRPGRLKVLEQLESEVDIIMREFAQAS